MNLLRLTPITGLLWILAAAPAWAGPPLICHPIAIGSQHSLPWAATDGWNGADASYDIGRLTGDTLGLLGAGTPVDVRMETLRRAAIYAARGPALTDRLAIALVARAMNAGAAGRPDPGAWFDAGYFVETARQATRIYPLMGGTAEDALATRRDLEGIDGVAWIQMAVRLGGADMQPVVGIVERAKARD